MDPAIYKLQRELNSFRTHHHSQVLRWLQALDRPARSIARLFSWREMYLLSLAYEYLPWQPMAQHSQGQFTREGEFIHTVSSQLADSLQYIKACPRHAEVMRVLPESEALTEIHRKVSSLNGEQITALQVILEAARAVPAGAFSSDTWWFPDTLIKLLQPPQPEPLLIQEPAGHNGPGQGAGTSECGSRSASGAVPVLKAAAPSRRGRRVTSRTSSRRR